MAAYKISTYSVENARYSNVLSSLETQLETLDSTSNPIRLITVAYKADTNTFVGMLVYDIP